MFLYNCQLKEKRYLCFLFLLLPHVLYSNGANYNDTFNIAGPKIHKFNAIGNKVAFVKELRYKFDGS